MYISRCVLITVLGMYTIQSYADTHYADAANSEPTAPYTNWMTAATTIQDAVDAADQGDIVLVSDGLYGIGTRQSPDASCSNRVVITQDITVKSVNGPSQTFILGAQSTGGGCGEDAVRCVYLGAGTLIGFTLTNGYTHSVGGG